MPRLPITHPRVQWRIRERCLKRARESVLIALRCARAACSLRELATATRLQVEIVAEAVDGLMARQLVGPDGGGRYELLGVEDGQHGEA